MRVKIEYGTGHECVTEFPNGTTVGCIVKNASVKGILGYGANVEGRIRGVPQSDDTPLYGTGATPPGVDHTVVVTDKACTKAS